MAAKKKAAVVIEAEVDPQGATGDGRFGPISPPIEWDERKFFVQDVARQVLLTISSKRSNGAPVRGDEIAAVTSAKELANLLGL